MADKQPGNVVPIHEHGSFTRRFSPADAARLLHEANDLARAHTAAAVARALDNVDDALFALADKAGTDVLQGHYFDAMREVRLKRQDIETAFKRSFATEISAVTPQSAAVNAAAAGLSLVEHDDLEESLAIDALVDKLEALCHAELSSLRQRVAFLHDNVDRGHGELALGPKALCSAFKTACTGIDSGVDIKIIVFKLFDRYLCETIQRTYQEINNYLAGKGVLPRITSRINNGQRAPGKLHHPMNSDNRYSSETDFLAAYSQLLNTRPQSQVGYSSSDFSGSGAAFMHDLTRLQQGQWEVLCARGIQIDPAALGGDTTNVVRIIKEQASGDGHGGGGMVMEVVALLFDYIFDNADIPDRAKALIGRLQIPTLKVAMLDQSFFSKRQHPARQLLNTLAHASLGLHGKDCEQSALYRELERCIQRLLVEFDTDIGVFEAVLRDLEAYLERHENHLSETVDEAKKVIQGRERLKIAESLAEAEIELRLADKPYPEFIKTFALDKWKNLLLVAYLKEGRESEAWKNRLELLDLLIWSCLPKSSLKDKKQLLDLLPTLLVGIENGMAMLSMVKEEQEAFLEKLAACHARAVNAEAYRPPPPPVSLKASALPGEGEPVASVAHTADGAAATAAAAQPSDGLWVEEITLLDGPRAENADQEEIDARLMANIDPFGLGSTTPPAEPADGIAELVQSLVPGVWLEFHQDDGKRVERLSWISRVLGSYLFTDNDGLKARELSTAELEMALRDGQAAVADDMSLLVDRSLSALLDDLQKKIG